MLTRTGEQANFGGAGTGAGDKFSYFEEPESGPNHQNFCWLQLPAIYFFTFGIN